MQRMLSREVLKPALNTAKSGENYLIALVNLGSKSRVIKECLLDCYKKIIPIEIIAKEEKLELWNYAKEKWPNATKQELIDKCLYLYIIGNLF